MKNTAGKRFPVWLNINGCDVRVFSENGNLEDLCRRLTHYGARVRMIDDSPEDTGEEAAAGSVDLARIRKKYERDDLPGADLVISGLTDREANKDLGAACRCLGIPVSIQSDPAGSTFFLEDLPQEQEE